MSRAHGSLRCVQKQKYICIRKKKLSTNRSFGVSVNFEPVSRHVRQFTLHAMEPQLRLGEVTIKPEYFNESL